ncbi:MAG: carbohydrate ABC transporter permease [Planctomycetota bacterium]|jgi:multiple sugar transport system permease protein
MPIITRIGRKAWSIRLLIWSVYAILTVGSVTMIYPFLMMISLSLSSRADFKENQLVPRWFYSEDALYRKFAFTKYNEIDLYNRRFNTHYAEFDYGGKFRALSLAAVNWPRIVAVEYDLDNPQVAARISDYEAFKAAFVASNDAATECLHITTRSQSTVNLLLDAYVGFLLAKYGSLDGINAAYKEENRELREIYAIRERPIFKTYLRGRDAKFEDWAEFKQRMAEQDLEFINIGDVEAEWGRYLQSKYGTEENFNEVFGTDHTAFYAIALSYTVPGESASDAARLLREHWIDFARSRVPLRFMGVRDPDVRFRAFLREKHGTIESLNGIYASTYASFDEMDFPAEISYSGPVTNDIYAFVLSNAVAPEDITIKSARWFWMDFLRGKYGTLEAANAAHSITYSDWDEVRLPPRLPLNGTAVERADWRRFVVEVCPIDHLLPVFSRDELRDFVQSEYDDIAALNAAWGTDYDEFRDVRPPRAGKVTPGQERELRKMLAENYTPVFFVRFEEDPPEGAYRDFLRARYGDIAAYNEAIRLYASWEQVRRPIGEVEWADYTSKRSWLIREYIFGNYRAVVNYMALHGRAFLNTLVLCAAMITAALTVNPLCAYALSRFQLSYANSILLFLLATMAFPVAVTQIPNFLLLRDLHLLNTYWALILPGLANGYSIFLLKGFFDSLPQELFEAGLIDGASEVQMFYRIALPLTKPVLAVIALGAFTLAYGQFMWAFIVCQNPKYWTIMVFLYQFQQDYAVPLVMAGLVLASLPTLLVFIAAQKVILRGIVVPQMK